MGCFGRKEKRIRCTIVLLDETDIIHEIEKNALGEELLDFVFKHLNLLEHAYFGLRFINKFGESRWLDPTKTIIQQLKGASGFTFYFGVKFYASDPCKLQEEITRYLFVLQIKQDILQGRFPINLELGAELFAFSLQSELGDYDPRRHDKQYVSEFRFLPTQSLDLEEKVAEIHKSLSGKVPSVVEMAFLEKVKWQDMYGVDLHVVMGEDNVEYFLCLTPSGITVMKNGAKVSNYFWPRISKAFFKGKFFMLRVRNKANEENTYAFELSSKDSCKHLWKCCVEHHAFFRLTQVKDLSSLPFTIFKLGSKHRYSGRTEQQVRSDMKLLKRPQQTIVRVPSRRYPKRLGEPDGAEADTKVEEKKICTIPRSKDDLLLKQPAVFVAPLYRSASTPAELPTIHSTIDTAQTAPWENPNQRGLFSHSSHHSLCSSRGSERRHSRHSHSHGRSSSVDSEISNAHRRKRHRSKNKSSDNESEISKSSKGSRASKSSRGSSHHHKSRRHGHDTGSDSDAHSRRKHSKHRSRSSGSNRALVDSEEQWKMVQMRQEKNDFWSQNTVAVVRDLSQRKSGYMNSGIDTESEMTYSHRKKHRRHSRSRSRSPESKQVIHNEVKKHILYNLIDPSELTNEQKHEIKYTKVESENDVLKARRSPASGKPRYKLAKVSSRSSLDKVSHRRSIIEDEDPPPPYGACNESAKSSSSKQDFSTNHLQNSFESRHRKSDVEKHSTLGISDSSSSSVSSALHSRKENFVSNNMPSTHKVHSAKHLSNLVESSTSHGSSGTESGSNNWLTNGNIQSQNISLLIPNHSAKKVLEDRQKSHATRHRTREYITNSQIKSYRHNRNMKTEL